MKTKMSAQKTKDRTRFLSPKDAPPPSDSEQSVSDAADHPNTEWKGIEDDGDSDEDIEMEADVPPKDEEEVELERLVFGDSAGFKAGIKSFAEADKSRTLQYSLEGDQEDEDEGALEAIPDDNLFFFDTGPEPAPGTALTVANVVEEEDEADKAVWEDSDDDHLVVSLASVPRLRKLRETEEDDVVSGREYIRRLRKQYLSLYPPPDWALEATGKAKRKRDRVGHNEESEASGSEMDLDSDDELSAQPLAKLLRDADLLSRTSTGPHKKRKLQPGTVDIQRLKDVTGKGPSAITSLSFHPSYPLLLSSGPSSTLSLHHINSSSATNPNPLLTSLHIKRTPLITTAFHPSPDDSRIFLSARRRYFHVWNLTTGTVEKVTRIYGHQHEQKTMEYFSLSPNGKYMALRGSSRKGGGVVNFLDAHTLQWIAQVRVESRGGIADFAWWGDGNGVTVVGKNGEVTEWSIKEERVLARWQDEGAVGTTTIALGGLSGRDNWFGGDRWVAIGSSSGIVNVYDRRIWAEAISSRQAASEDANQGIPPTPSPVRAFDNLTTPVSHLAFSPDGQVLAMASRWKHAGMRLVHLPSCTVFKNWPTDKTPLGRISSMAWGRPSVEEEKEGSLALLAVGSETGRIRLWEVRA